VKVVKERQPSTQQEAILLACPRGTAGNREQKGHWGSRLSNHKRKKMGGGGAWKKGKVSQKSKVRGGVPGGVKNQGGKGG